MFICLALLSIMFWIVMLRVMVRSENLIVGFEDTKEIRRVLYIQEIACPTKTKKEAISDKPSFEKMLEMDTDEVLNF